MVLPVQAGWIVCIADGTGGISGGAAAAELFITGVRRAALQSRFDLADPATWATLVEALDDEIAAEPHAGETTGIALAITSGLVVGASCGDSRAWLSTRTGWQDLTSRQSRRPRLGTGRASAQSFSAVACGTLVVGTDGLFDHVNAEHMTRAVVGGSDTAADALVRLVLDRHRSPPDDIAVVVGWLD